MEPEWLSYQEVGDRLGITPEAARSRAKRLGWRRQLSNTGRAIVLVALEPRSAGDGPVTPGRKDNPVHELQARVARLEGELAGKDALIAEVSQSRDDWKTQAERLAKAIATPAPAPEATKVNLPESQEGRPSESSQSVTISPRPSWLSWRYWFGWPTAA